jgi:NAD(P)-dependent dehydrogenase (short-subunit alcohol dehydrogenase family)
MKDILENKVAVITGAGGGIGRAVSVRLAQAGMKIVLLGGNNTANLEMTRREAAEYSACAVLAGDLTDSSFYERAIDSAAECFGGIDVLVNNAGAAANSPFEQVKVEDFDRIMAINVRTPFILMQKAVPYLKKSDCASIINIASVVAHAGYPFQSPYVASKHALLGLTKSAAAELFRDNIRVHAVSPGGVYTDMVKLTRPDLSAEGMIMPEDIADIVHFILSRRNNAVIDEILVHRAGKEPFLV